MFRIAAILILVFSSFQLSAQHWVEDFGTDATCGIADADGYATANGVWTVQSTGANGILAHNWYIGARESEMDEFECGDGCLNDGALEENTLYVSSELLNATDGAVFQSGSTFETNLRAVSPVVSFVGLPDTMVLNINYIYSGHPNTSCVLEYFDGTSWYELWDVAETIGSCGNAGEWTQETIILPLSILGNPSVQFGIRWENTDAGDMPDPELSFALGEIECVCQTDITNEYPDPFDQNVDENPDIEIVEDDCFTTVTETYFLAPWAAALYGEPNVVLSCSAGANENCTVEGIDIDFIFPGCSDGFQFAVGANNEYSGPVVENTGWGEVVLQDSEICVGQCVDFTYYSGFYSASGADVSISLEAPGGTATYEEEPWDPAISGQICYDSPGTYNVTGHSSMCGLTEEIPAYTSITVLPANFTPEINISDTEICPGECIEIDMEGIGDPGLTVSWSFSGATPATSDQFDPGEICFDQIGSQDIFLSVESPTGCGSANIEGGVIVQDCQPPTVNFLANIPTICAGECVDFTDESTGTDNETWNWTFEGASQGTSSLQNPTGICFETPGFYDVTLSVSNAMGTDELTIPNMIEVEDCSPPSASFSVSSTEICVGDCIDFTDESTGPDILSWSWDFEGAEPEFSYSQNPASICYFTPGIYEVTLNVGNPNGQDEVTETTFITVDPCYPDPIPEFSVDLETICAGECVNFTNTSTTTGITSWSWSFEGADDSVSDQEAPSGICYSTPGTYDVTLEVTDEGGTESITYSDLITVDPCPDPVADFTANNTSVCFGDCVSFQNLSTGDITFYEWYFPGAVDSTSTEVNPTVCYPEPGSYPVTLIAGDAEDTSTTTLTGFVYVDPCLPVLEVEPSEDRICLGDCISFTNVSEDPSSNWSWSFPGAETTASSEEHPTEICYFDPGVYDVGLQVEVSGVIVDTTFQGLITVIDSCGPVANFNFTPIVCLGQCYDFENTSEGGTDYFWVFDGAATPVSELESPTDICYLDETGVFNVTLTVADEFGSSTSITQQVSVVPPSSLSAGPDQTVVQGNEAILSANAGGSSGEFIWQPFEDVDCFSCASTSTVSLNETTTFVVYFEESGGCQTTDTVTVFVEESLAFGIPGSFSPNGDGVNDVLYFRGSNISRFNLMIYNRYGQKVFETSDQSVGWDGTHDSRELNSGVFGYYLEVYQTDGTRSVLKGDVTVVR